MRRALLTILAIILFLCADLSAAASNLDYEIPQEIQAAAVKYGDEYGISPYLLLAIMRYESCYVPTVTGGSCKGLMQINEPCHQDRMKRLGVTDIYDIDSNVHVGADYIAELYDTYGDYGIVLGLYHGESKAIKNGRRGIYSGYVLKILNKASELEEELSNDPK